MDQDTTAVITIQFENYVDNEQLLKVFNQAGSHLIPMFSQLTSPGRHYAR